MLFQQCLEPLLRATAGGHQKQSASGLLLGNNMPRHRVKQIDILLLALGGKTATGAAIQRHPVRMLKRANAAPPVFINNLLPFIGQNIKRVRGQRLDDAPPITVFPALLGIGFHRLLARLIIIGDLLMPVMQRAFGLVISDIKRCAAMVKQRFQRVMK